MSIIKEIACLMIKNLLHDKKPSEKSENKLDLPQIETDESKYDIAAALEKNTPEQMAEEWTEEQQIEADIQDTYDMYLSYKNLLESRQHTYSIELDKLLATLSVSTLVASVGLAKFLSENIDFIWVMIISWFFLLISVGSNLLCMHETKIQYNKAISDNETWLDDRLKEIKNGEENKEEVISQEEIVKSRVDRLNEVSLVSYFAGIGFILFYSMCVYLSKVELSLDWGAVLNTLSNIALLFLVIVIIISIWIREK